VAPPLAVKPFHFPRKRSYAVNGAPATSRSAPPCIPDAEPDEAMELDVEF